MEILILAGVAIALAGIGAVLWQRSRRRVGSERTGTRAEGWKRSEKLSLAGILVGAGVGALGYVLPSDDGPGQTDPDQPNPVALGALLREGPFTEPLPDPLTAGDIEDVQIGDPAAVDRVEAMQLSVDVKPPIDSAFAHLEVYRTTSSAAQRAQARIDEIKRLYGAEQILGTSASYCAYLDPNPAAWECGGSSGLVYAEATVSPSGNAYRPAAEGTASALLRYADEKSRVAQ
jgi:hypothetical protein